MNKTIRATLLLIVLTGGATPGVAAEECTIAGNWLRAGFPGGDQRAIQISTITDVTLTGPRGKGGVATTAIKTQSNTTALCSDPSGALFTQLTRR